MTRLVVGQRVRTYCGCEGVVTQEWGPSRFCLVTLTDDSCTAYERQHDGRYNSWKGLTDISGAQSNFITCDPLAVALKDRFA